MRRILIAGMGNVLRGDDGFGVETARRLAGRQPLPAGVQVIEVGIGGIHLVQELMDGYDALIIIDAVEQGSSPGTCHVLQPEVPNLATWSAEQRGEFLADMHYTTPAKALILAKALGVLPPELFIFGCQPAETEDLSTELSVPVQRAVPLAVEAILSLVSREQACPEGTGNAGDGRRAPGGEAAARAD